MGRLLKSKLHIYEPLAVQVLDVAENGETYALEIGKVNARNYIHSVFLELGFTSTEQGCWEKSLIDKAFIWFYIAQMNGDFFILHWRGEYKRTDLFQGTFAVSAEDSKTETDASFLGEAILDNFRDYIDWVNEKVETENQQIKERQDESQE